VVGGVVITDNTGGCVGCQFHTVDPETNLKDCDSSRLAANDVLDEAVTVNSVGNYFRI